MKLLFSQKHIELLSLDNLTAVQFLCLAIETSKLLGWVFGNITETGFIAYTSNGLFSWNAEIKLKIIFFVFRMLIKRSIKKKLRCLRICGKAPLGAKIRTGIFNY